AATVMFGIGMMAFARFGKFHHAGIAISFGIGVTLIVVMTFTAALLRLTGKWLFWPRQLMAPKQADQSISGPVSTTWISWFSWETVAQGILRRPAFIWFVCVALMAPFAVSGVM